MRRGGDLESEGESDEGERGQVGEWGGSLRRRGCPYPLAGDVAARGAAPGRVGTSWSVLAGRTEGEEGIECGEEALGRLAEVGRGPRGGQGLWPFSSLKKNRDG